MALASYLDHSLYFSPSSPTEQSCLPPQHKAELITLPISQYNVSKLCHHSLCTPVHQLQGSRIVWLLKPMLVGKSEEITNLSP